MKFVQPFLALTIAIGHNPIAQARKETSVDLHAEDASYWLLFANMSGSQSFATTSFPSRGPSVAPITPLPMMPPVASDPTPSPTSPATPAPSSSSSAPTIPATNDDSPSLSPVVIVQPSVVPSPTAAATKLPTAFPVTLKPTTLVPSIATTSFEPTFTTSTLAPIKVVTRQPSLPPPPSEKPLAAPVQVTSPPSLTTPSEKPIAPIQLTPQPSLTPPSEKPFAPIPRTPQPSPTNPSAKSLAPVKDTPQPSLITPSAKPLAPVPRTPQPSLRPPSEKPIAQVPQTPKPSLSTPSAKPIAPVPRTLQPSLSTPSAKPIAPVPRTPQPSLTPPSEKPLTPVTRTPQPSLTPPSEKPIAQVPQTPKPSLTSPSEKPLAPVPRTPQPSLTPSSEKSLAPVPRTPKPSLTPPTAKPLAPVPRTPQPSLPPPTEKPAPKSKSPTGTPAPTRLCDLQVGLKCTVDADNSTCEDLSQLTDLTCSCDQCVNQIILRYTGAVCSPVGGNSGGLFNCTDSTSGPSSESRVVISDEGKVLFDGVVDVGTEIVLNAPNGSCLGDALGVRVLSKDDEGERLQTLVFDTTCDGTSGIDLLNSFGSLDFIGYKCVGEKAKNCFESVTYEMCVSNKGGAIINVTSFEFSVNDTETNIIPILSPGDTVLAKNGTLCHTESDSIGLCESSDVCANVDIEGKIQATGGPCSSTARLCIPVTQSAVPQSPAP